MGRVARMRLGPILTPIPDDHPPGHIQPQYADICAIKEREQGCAGKPRVLPAPHSRSSYKANEAHHLTLDGSFVEAVTHVLLHFRDEHSRGSTHYYIISTYIVKYPTGGRANCSDALS
jgi:hypothetical protein